MFAAYEETQPPAPGATHRRDPHALPPLLVHAILFGGGRVGAVRRTLVRCGGAVGRPGGEGTGARTAPAG